MIVIEVLGWFALALISALIAGFVKGHFRRKAADRYHALAMEQLAQDRELEKKLAQLKQAAATSENPQFR